MGITANIDYDVQSPTLPSEKFLSILSHVQANSDYWHANTSKAHIKKAGQIFTPLNMSLQLSSLMNEDDVRKDFEHIGDAGAGTGMLSITMAARLASMSKPPALKITGYESDTRLHMCWCKAWARLEHAHAQVDVNIFEDFTDLNAVEHLLKTGALPFLSKPTQIVSNPPYNKISPQHPLNQLMRKYAVPVPNYYALFVILSLVWLEDGGSAYFILPRSFSNGSYFTKFREYLKENASLEHVVLYRSRHCFKHATLEGVLIKLTKGKKQNGKVRFTVSESPDCRPDVDLVLNSSQVVTDDIFIFPSSIRDIELLNEARKKPATLDSLGFEVSVGKVILDRLKGEAETTMVYASDFKDGKFTWAERKKPRRVKTTQRNVLKLPETGGYVVLKRISSNGSNTKANKPVTRLFPVALTRNSTGFKEVACHIHLQVVSKKGGMPLSEIEIEHLLALFNSDEANAVIRSVSGSTQLNKGDFDYLRLEDFVGEKA